MAREELQWNLSIVNVDILGTAKASEVFRVILGGTYIHKTVS